MKFVVKRPFKWDERQLERGDNIELEERHPRTAGLLQGRFITYDPSNAPTTNEDDQVPTVAERARAILGGR